MKAEKNKKSFINITHEASRFNCKINAQVLFTAVRISGPFVRFLSLSKDPTQPLWLEVPGNQACSAMLDAGLRQVLLPGKKEKTKKGKKPVPYKIFQKEEEGSSWYVVYALRRGDKLKDGFEVRAMYKPLHPHLVSSFWKSLLRNVALGTAGSMVIYSAYLASRRKSLVDSALRGKSVGKQFSEGKEKNICDGLLVFPEITEEALESVMLRAAQKFRNLVQKVRERWSKDPVFKQFLIDALVLLQTLVPGSRAARQAMEEIEKPEPDLDRIVVSLALFAKQFRDTQVSFSSLLNPTLWKKSASLAEPLDVLLDPELVSALAKLNALCKKRKSLTKEVLGPFTVTQENEQVGIEESLHIYKDQYVSPTGEWNNYRLCMDDQPVNPEKITQFVLEYNFFKQASVVMDILEQRVPGQEEEKEKEPEAGKWLWQRFSDTLYKKVNTLYNVKSLLDKFQSKLKNKYTAVEKDMAGCDVSLCVTDFLRGKKYTPCENIPYTTISLS